MDLRRRPPHRATKRATMIVYSGDVQADYLHWMKKTLDHAEIPLESMPETAAPIDFVRAAKRLKDAARKDGSPYDRVWCLVNQHPDLDDAIQLARKQRVQLVISRPAFPVWLLLHFEEVGDQPSASEVMNRVARYLPELATRNNGSLDPLASKYDEARARATAMRNPGSGMYELIDYVRESLQSYLGGEDPRLL